MPSSFRNKLKKEKNITFVVIFGIIGIILTAFTIASSSQSSFDTRSRAAETIYPTPTWHIVVKDLAAPIPGKSCNTVCKNLSGICKYVGANSYGNSMDGIKSRDTFGNCSTPAPGFTCSTVLQPNGISCRTADGALKKLQFTRCRCLVP